MSRKRIYGTVEFFSEMEEFKTRYKNWHRNRRKLMEIEDSGVHPHFSDFEASDDEGIELLHEMAEKLWGPMDA